MIPSDDLSSIALLYHLNSEPTSEPPSEELANYLCDRRDSATNTLATPVVLPNIDEPNLDPLFARRYSCRTFVANKMSLSCLSTLLRSAYGIVRTRTEENQGEGGSRNQFPRTVPSAGGMYPLTIRAVVQGITGISDGLYRYNIYWPSLEPVIKFNVFEEVANCFITKEFVTGANLLAIMSGKFEPVLSKYGPRGYRYLLLEAGHVGQNLCLAAATNHLGSLCLGGFQDAKLNAFLGMDGTSEAVLYCVAIGFPTKRAGYF